MCVCVCLGVCVRGRSTGSTMVGQSLTAPLLPAAPCLLPLRQHVLCEKPWTCNAVEAMAIGRASEDAGYIAVEAFHVLHHPVAIRARAAVGGTIILLTLCLHHHRCTD